MKLMLDTNICIYLIKHLTVPNTEAGLTQLLACMRKLLTIVNAMLTHRMPWRHETDTAGTGA